MSRFLLSVFALLICLSFSANSLIAQEKPSSNSKTTSKTDVAKKQTEDELLRDLLFCQCLRWINAPLSSIPKGPSLITSVTIAEWTEKWVQQNAGDPNHAHDPVTGQNYNWDSDKKAWIDSKTGECICPKCETVKENTEPKKEANQPNKENEPKKGNINYQNPTFEIAGGVGYGFSFNGGLLGQNRTFTATDRTFDGVYGSWAQGENFFIKMDFKVSNCFNVGVEFDYTYGKNIIWDQNTIGVTTTTDQHYEGRYTGYSATPFIQFNPCGSNRFNPYVDLGLRLNFSNTIKQNLTQTQTSNNNTTTTVQKATLKGAFAPGIDAALGAKYCLSNRLAILAELYSSNSNFVQGHATIDKYTVNGTDQLNTFNFSQTHTDYVKRFTVPTSNPDINSPSKALRSPIPLSTIGIKFGLDYKF